MYVSNFYYQSHVCKKKYMMFSAQDLLLYIILNGVIVFLFKNMLIFLTLLGILFVWGDRGSVPWIYYRKI